MRPRFGAGLERFVHEQNTLTTRRRMRDAIAAALGQWEPRILVDRIDVWEVVDAAKTKLNAAVAAGRLTQSQADSILAGLKSHITDFVNGTAPHFRLRNGFRGSPPPGPGFGGNGL